MRESVIFKSFRQKFIFLLIHANIVTIFVLFTSKIGTVQAFPRDNGVHVDGYQESEVPVYPFQQYIQVRKTYTVEHVPMYHQEAPSSHNLDVSASNNHHGSSNDHQPASTSTSDDHQHSSSDGQHYHVPRLREEISDYKKQEVYEEKGYGDSAYDHHRYKGPSSHHQHYNEYPEHEDSDRSVAESSAVYKNEHGDSQRKFKQPRRHSLHSPDGSSTKLLEYVATNLHDRDAQQKGIYSARSNIYCPEVIDFDLSSKAMAMGEGKNRRSKPRLQGLGSKITCLKNKYFGREPLPKAIFAEPSESRASTIQIPSFNNFFEMVRYNVDSASSFQNGNVPI